MSYKQISYSAPARVFLSGEHSLDHGQPAFLTSIDLRLKFTIIETSKAQKLDSLILSIKDAVLNYLNKNSAQKLENQTLSNFKYKTESNIPENQGLGEQAAFIVSAVAAIYDFYSQTIPTKEIVYDIACTLDSFAELDFFEADIAGSLYGGLVFFRKEFEYLSFAKTLPFTVPESWQDKIYLIFTGKADETPKKLKDGIFSLLEESPARYKKLIRDIGKTTKAMTRAFMSEDKTLLENTILRNEKFLSGLQVVSKTTQTLTEEIKNIAVVKTSGLGGFNAAGGYVLAVTKTGKNKNLESYLMKNKMFWLKANTSKIGLQIENAHSEY